MYAALLGLPVVGADIPFIICGPEFGMKNKGKVALIKRALYGGKVVISGIISVWLYAANWIHIVKCDPDVDVWFRQSKQATGEDYYEYVLLYVDAVILRPSPPLLEGWYGMVLWHYDCQPWLKAFKHFL